MALFGLSAGAIVLACGAGPTTAASSPGAATTTPLPPALASAAPAPAPSPVEPPASAASPVVPPPEAVHHEPSQLEPALAKARAPDVFRARFVTTKGPFVVEVHRDWAPNGADRFYNLVKLGFFDDTRFFRVIDGFMTQFGINGNPAVSSMWRTANIKDDPVVQSNRRSYITFAQTSAPDSRSTQVFINTADNTRLDASRFAPFGQVVSGMSVVDALYHGYGEGRPSGAGPDQGRVQEAGNRYLDEEFPQLDRIVSTQVQ